MDEDDHFAAELSMRILKGWKRISNKGGFVNEVTGQTLVVAKQEFGEHYHVLLFRYLSASQNKSSNQKSRATPIC